MGMSAHEWLQAYASVLGVAPPSPEEVDALLGLAGVAAHASERTAAPISCYLVARAGVSVPDALARAKALAAGDGHASGTTRSEPA